MCVSWSHPLNDSVVAVWRSSMARSSMAAAYVHILLTKVK